MNRWASYQQKAFVGGCVADGVVCPKPRRIGVPLFHEPIRPTSRLLHLNNQSAEAYDVKAGTELLDIIRMKGGYGSPRSNYQVGSSPPFLIGSPPSRASNPVIHDEQFGNDNGDAQSSSSSTCKIGGYVRANFGPKPAPVRIEGFNCSLSAVA